MDGEYNIHDELDSILQDGSSEPRNLPLEYLRKITNNFADDRLLGEGGFGKVYKGVLQNGTLVAVKKLDQLKVGIQERQFENEVYHLIRLKHSNIVRFIGYCYETRNECVQHNGKYIFAEMQQKLICLEYMPNGSLDRHLSDEFSGHDWHTRYKIIKGICCGLHYLHEECQCQFSASIIHLDLKPANILLDDNMGPKVADFGLSRFFEDTKTHTCATFVSGSLGYMAPEYLIGRIVTTKADVYNLGVIIIEIITGSKVNIFSYSSPASWQDFVECVLGKWRSRLEGAPSETDCKQIKCCLEIGLDCIKFNREERPTSREIIEMLDRWENTHCYIDNEPDITGTRSTAGADNNDDTGAPRSCGLPNWTSARGLVRRQLSRIMRRLMRQLSCVPTCIGRPKLPHCRASVSAYRPSEDFFGDELSLSPYPGEKFTFVQLEAATKGFAMEAKIGVGSFGTVYRGKLRDGREVAIKRRESGPGPRPRRFLERDYFLSRYNHKHIVGLVGYCHENKECLLVYEYMKNRALYDHLHPKEATPSSPSLLASSWKMRVKILLDASRGVGYLHSCLPSWARRKVHGHIKSSNILLDASWTARVSGYDLVSSPLPPWEDEAHPTVEDDVYAFGVVMLEVLTGKPAVFEEAAESSSSPVSVVDYYDVPMIVSGELGKVLDPRAPEPAAHEAEALALVAYAALHCVMLERKDRPAMDGIVASLETALALCEGTSGGGGFGHSQSSSASLPVTSTDRDDAPVSGVSKIVVK